jgi:uncharacterized protein YcnI
MKRISLTVVAAFALLLATATGAFAHVSVSADTTSAGAFAFATFSVPHGCEGKGTTKISIKIEEDLAYVTPFESPGWTVEATKRKLDKPMQAEHGELTEVTDEIVYTRDGAALPDGIGSALGVSMQLPESADGDTLFFPVVQECEGGLSTNWIQKAEEGEDAHELESPAPSITVGEAAGDDHGAMSDKADDEKSNASTINKNFDVLDDEIDSVRAMGYIALFLGALGLILALLIFRGRIRDNKKS